MTGKIVRTYDHIIYYNDSGKYHREDGPAIEYSSGGKEWYIDGELHREDGPAAILDYGSMFWFINGKRHREDGPAIVWNNGDKEWYINGVDITIEVNHWKAEMGITNDILTKEESALFVLYFGNKK